MLSGLWRMRYTLEDDVSSKVPPSAFRGSWLFQGTHFNCGSQGWGDGSVSKVLATMTTWVPPLQPHEQTNMVCWYGLAMSGLGTLELMNPWCLLASLDYMPSSRPARNPVSKPRWTVSEEWQLRMVSGLHTHIHTWLHICTWTHIHIYKHTNLHMCI